MAFADRLKQHASTASTSSSYDSISRHVFVKPFEVRMPLCDEDSLQMFEMVGRSVHVEFQAGRQMVHSDCLVSEYRVEATVGGEVTVTLQPHGPCLPVD